MWCPNLDAFRIMSVVAEVSLPATEFELGRIFEPVADAIIELEPLVPLCETTVPLFWLHGAADDSFFESLRRSPAVRSTTKIDVFNDRTLFRLDWDARTDEFISGIEQHDGHILNAIGQSDAWEFELRFATHEVLSSFSTYCREADLPLTVRRVYTPSDPEEAASEGLSDPQLEALTLATEMGYYDIPRSCSTKELAAELGISDQAVTERLRRAIVALTTAKLTEIDASM